MSFWNEGSDDENENEKVENQNKSNPFFMKKSYNVDDSGSSDGEKRVVKTPKEKLQDLIKEKSSKIRDGIENKSFVDISYNFDELMKSSDKIKSLFSEKVPDNFLRILFLVEDSLNVMNENSEEKKKLTKADNKAYNSLNRTYAKKIKEFEDALKHYKANKPTEDELEQEEKDEALSDVDALSDKSSVDMNDKADDPATRRLKWVKKKVDETTRKIKVKGAVTVHPGRQTNQVEEEEDDNNREVQQIVLRDSDIEIECNEISNQRGHLKMKPEEVAARISFLLTQTQTPHLRIKLLNLYILICFDTSPGQFSALSLKMWQNIHDSIITLLENYNCLKKDESEATSDGVKSLTYILQGSMVSILEKLELELYKALQFTDRNSSEYMIRVRDELKFLLLCSKIEHFYKELNDQLSISKIYMLIILHIYYKNEESIKKMIEKFNINVSRDEVLIKSCENPELFINQLCDKIYTYCDEKSKVKAIMAHVYFLCIHNRYTSAKSLFQKSYIFEIIQILKDDQLKILYNRTLAQLGLCAFRTGVYSDSLNYLHPLCQTGTARLKEYLSQSYNKENEKSIFFDKEDKKRMIPYIMTINIDEIESTYYIVSMIIDLPNIILYITGKKYKAFNQVFKKLLDNYQKQIFNGPPETIKELILCSASHLTKGDWAKCAELLFSLRIYNNYKNLTSIKQIITDNIKETGLRCYLIFYASQYTSLSTDNLVKKFQLDENKVRRIINRMILDGDINGRWNNKVLQMAVQESNKKVISRLQENLEIITQENLNLLQVAGKCK